MLPQSVTIKYGRTIRPAIGTPELFHGTPELSHTAQPSKQNTRANSPLQQ